MLLTDLFRRADKDCDRQRVNVTDFSPAGFGHGKDFRRMRARRNEDNPTIPKHSLINSPPRRISTRNEAELLRGSRTRQR